MDSETVPNFKPEIERRFLLSAPPDWPMEVRIRLSSAQITQGYYTDPNSDLVRLRKTEQANGLISYHQTIKRGIGVERQECETEINETRFVRDWPKTRGRRLLKHRQHVRLEEQTFVVDSFSDRDLTLAEIELESVDCPPQIPDWLAAVVVREVTDDPTYLNCNLAV